MARARTALLSVYYKEGIIEFARELRELGWNLLASGGTARALTAAGIEVQDIAVLVGEAILGHRVVTLSREVHAGLMARPGEQDDLGELERLGIPFIDLVCVDLYPLQAEIATATATRESVIEKTDIGGPAMLRSAAKGGRIVICRPEDRYRVIDWLKAGELDASSFLRELAARAEALVAGYSFASAAYHGQGQYAGVVGERVLSCKYGENPSQAPAALYSVSPGDDPLALSNFAVVAGTPPSYNNLTDLDRLLQALTHVAAAFDSNRGMVPRIAIAVKHGNPCGAAIGEDSADVLRRTVMGNSRAIFGGVVMANFPIGEAEAEILLTHGMEKGRRLLDGIIAPEFTPAAVELLKRKGDKCRFLANPALAALHIGSLDSMPRFRYVRGGFLRQPNYTYVIDLSSAGLVRTQRASRQQEDDMLLAWAIGTTSNSNTITIVREGQLIGNGVGQQDRVSAAQLAVNCARSGGHDTSGAVAYSDSFFPFTDGVEALTNVGIVAIYASSGSVRDGKVQEFCRERRVALYLFPDAKGRGFFGH